MDTVQAMLDHASPEMTAGYATINDQTLRREWERFQQTHQYPRPADPARPGPIVEAETHGRRRRSG